MLRSWANKTNKGHIVVVVCYLYINACLLWRTRRNVVPTKRSRSKMSGRLSSSAAPLHSVHHVIYIWWKLIFSFYLTRGAYIERERKKESIFFSLLTGARDYFTAVMLVRSPCTHNGARVSSPSIILFISCPWKPTVVWNKRQCGVPLLDYVVYSYLSYRRLRFMD